MQILANLIDSNYIPLKATDNAEVAIELMVSQHLDLLPVLEEKKLVGLVKLIDLIDLEASEKVETLIKMKDEIPSLFVNQYFFEAINFFKSHQVKSWPVLNSENEVEGVLRIEAFYDLFSPAAFQNQQAAAVGLVFNQIDYSLTQIANIVEYSNNKVLQLITFPLEDHQILVHLIINNTAIQSVIKGFERYNYQILYAFHQDTDADNTSERYNSLLKYLDL